MIGWRNDQSFPDHDQGYRHKYKHMGKSFSTRTLDHGKRTNEADKRSCQTHGETPIPLFSYLDSTKAVNFHRNKIAKTLDKEVVEAETTEVATLIVIVPQREGSAYINIYHSTSDAVVQQDSQRFPGRK